MEENNNQVKIKLTTAIALTLILILFIVAIILILFNNNIKDGNNGLEKNIIVENEEKKSNNESEDYSKDEFPLQFLKLEDKKENIIYSPLSIKYALQMLNDGANGNTKNEIENVIGNMNLSKYNNINNILALSNALYIRNTYSKYVKEEYKDTIYNKYNAEIKSDDFKDASNINSWIENKTFGKIKNMISDEIVKDENNEMILINALAIDMDWKDKFDAKDTNSSTFYLDNNNSMKVAMMNKETKSDSISYYINEGITALAMDLEKYEDEQMEFIAIMPENNLSDYIKEFSTSDIENITNNLTVVSETKYGLDISIPRFSFDYDLSLKEDLKSLGIKDAFKESADFSNMSSKRSLHVGEALHKSNIDFTEKGIKATATTAIIMADKSIGIDIKEKPQEIKIDKPFIYLIRNKKTNEIGFIGAVYQPDDWEKVKENYKYDIF